MLVKVILATLLGVLRTSAEVRFPCRVIPRIPELRYNQILAGSSFASIWDVSLHDCITECGQRSTCVSGNYFRLARGLCQLNSDRGQNDRLVTQRGAAYFSMDEDMRTVIVSKLCENRPCDDGRRCGIDTDSKHQCRVQECTTDPITGAVLASINGTNTVGSRRQVACEANTTFPGRSNMTVGVSVCQADGTWSLVPGPCAPVQQVEGPSTSQTTANTPTPSPITQPTTTTISTKAAATTTPTGTTDIAAPNTDTTRHTTTTSTPPATTVITPAVTTTPRSVSPTSNNTNSTNRDDKIICDDNWERFGINCYFIQRKITPNWTEAKSVCQWHDADLVSIDDDDQYQFLGELASRAEENPNFQVTNTFWIGGQFGVTEWLWVPANETNARPITYFHWLNGVIQTGDTGHCLSLSREVGQTAPTPNRWYYTSVQCDDLQDRNVICQKTGQEPPSEDPTTTTSTTTETPTQNDIICDANWEGFGTNCYVVDIDITPQWTEAKSVCQRHDADLVSIDDDGQYEFIGELASRAEQNPNVQVTNTFWIGGQFGVPEWLWVPANETNVRPITYFQWLNGVAPNGDTGQCLALSREERQPATTPNGWYYTSVQCDDLQDRNVICQKREQHPPTEDPTTSTPTTTKETPTQNDISCDANWEGFGINCYAVDRDITSQWNEAKSVCQRYDANLVSIDDDGQYEFLGELASRAEQNPNTQVTNTFWIGGQFGVTEWLWLPANETNARPINYFQWLNGVAQTGDTGLCLALSQETAPMPNRWYYTSVQCDDLQDRNVICQKRAQDPPSEDPTTSTTTTTETPTQNEVRCEDTWDPYGDLCYQVIAGEQSKWKQARDECRALDGNLVSVHDDSQYGFLTELIDNYATTAGISSQRDTYWIGGIFEDEWIWNTDEDRTINYFRWLSPSDTSNYEISVNTKHCLVLRQEAGPDWYYVSVPCDDSVLRHPVCQRQPIQDSHRSDSSDDVVDN